MEMQTDCLGMLLWSPSAAPALAGRCCTGSSHWAISEPLKAPQELESSLELRVSILSFWSLQCVCCVSATSSWRCSCLSCCLNTANKGVLYHLIKKPNSYKQKPAPSVGQPGVCCCLWEMGEERGDISSMGSHHTCWTPSFTQLFLSPKNVNPSIIPSVPLYWGEFECMN